MAGYKALFFEMTAYVFLKKMSINYTTHNEGIIGYTTYKDIRGCGEKIYYRPCFDQ